MDKLKEWLFYEGLTVTEFAKRLEISRTYLHEILADKVIPSPMLKRVIEDETRGDVARDMWGSFEDHKKRMKKKATKQKKKPVRENGRTTRI